MKLAYLLIVFVLLLNSCTYSPESKVVGVWETITNKTGDSARFYFNEDKKTGHYWVFNDKKLIGVINFNYAFSKDYKKLNMDFVSSNPPPYSDLTAADFFHSYDVTIHDFTDDQLKISFMIQGISQNYDLRKVKN